MQEVAARGAKIIIMMDKALRRPQWTCGCLLLPNMSGHGMPFRCSVWRIIPRSRWTRTRSATQSRKISHCRAAKQAGFGGAVTERGIFSGITIGRQAEPNRRHRCCLWNCKPHPNILQMCRWQRSCQETPVSGMTSKKTGVQNVALYSGNCELRRSRYEASRRGRRSERAVDGS